MPSGWPKHQRGEEKKKRERTSSDIRSGDRVCDKEKEKKKKGKGKENSSCLYQFFLREMPHLSSRKIMKKRGGRKEGKKKKGGKK